MPTTGHVEYSEPRAVQIREDSSFVNPKTHAAISGTVNLTAETVTDRTKILNSWHEIMDAINMKVLEIVGRADG